MSVYLISVSSFIINTVSIIFALIVLSYVLRDFLKIITNTRPKEWGKALWWNHFYIITASINVLLMFTLGDLGLGGLIFYFSLAVIGIFYIFHWIVSLSSILNFFRGLTSQKKWYFGVTLHIPAVILISFGLYIYGLP